MKEALIPELPLNLARLLGRLAGRDIALPLTLAGGALFTLRPEPAEASYIEAAADRQEPGPGELRFTLEAGGEPWLVEAQGTAAQALLALPSGLSPEEVPPELKPAFLSLALEPLLARASAALGQSLGLSAGRAAPPEGALLSLPFNITDATGAAAGNGLALIPAGSASMSILAALAKRFPRRRADCSTVTLCLALCAGRESLPLKLLREAAPGDVLLLDAPAPPCLTLAVGNRDLWKAELREGKLALTGLLEKAQESAMNATPEEKAAPAPTPKAGAGGGPDQAPLNQAPLDQAALDTLEVILSLELEERRISLGELAALTPGQTLETTASLEQPVTLKINGRAVGKGRLLDVGGRLGVMINSLCLAGQPDDD